MNANLLISNGKFTSEASEFDNANQQIRVHLWATVVLGVNYIMISENYHFPGHYIWLSGHWRVLTNGNIVQRVLTADQARWGSDVIMVRHHHFLRSILWRHQICGSVLTTCIVYLTTFIVVSQMHALTTIELYNRRWKIYRTIIKYCVARCKSRVDVTDILYASG